MSDDPYGNVEAPLSGLPALQRVTAVMVNFNSGPWLARCVGALRDGGSDAPPIEIVDNASKDDSLEQLPDLPRLRVQRSMRNLGFARGVNWAAGSANTEYLLIINPDCLLSPAALTLLVQDLDENPDAAMVSGRVLDMQGREQRGSRRRLPTRQRVLNEVWGHGKTGVDLTQLPAPDQPCEVEAVSGACMLVRRQAFAETGGLDEGYPLHFEDLDFMARLRNAGWKIRLLPQVAVSHAGGVSSRSRPVQVMWKKHRGLWRYLTQHPESPWPLWNRWLWWLAIHARAVLLIPRTVWSDRGGGR